MGPCRPSGPNVWIGNRPGILGGGKSQRSTPTKGLPKKTGVEPVPKLYKAVPEPRLQPNQSIRSAVSLFV